MKNLKENDAFLGPEEEWERLEPYGDFSRKELREILRLTLDRDEIRSHEVVTGGKCNTNIAVEFSDGERVVIRVYERDRWACRRDQVITEEVACRVPVPKMLAAVVEPGRFSGAVAEKLAGRPVGVFEWVQGRKPFEVFQRDAEAIEKVGFVLGQTLMNIHESRRFSHHGLLDEELNYRRKFASTRASFVDFLEWSLTDGRAGQRLGASTVSRLRTFIDENVHRLEAVEGAQGLVHGDYKSSNLLVGPVGDDWEVRAVLDWEFACAGTPLFDAATLLRNADRWPGFSDGFARGFKAGGGHLPDGWRRIVKLLDLMNLCGFLNGSEKREKTFEAVRALILETIS